MTARIGPKATPQPNNKDEKTPVDKKRKAETKSSVPKPTQAAEEQEGGPKRKKLKTSATAPAAEKVSTSAAATIVPTAPDPFATIKEAFIHKNHNEVLHLLGSVPKMAPAELATLHKQLSANPQLPKEKLDSIWSDFTKAETLLHAYPDVIRRVLQGIMDMGLHQARSKLDAIGAYFMATKTGAEKFKTMCLEKVLPQAFEQQKKELAAILQTAEQKAKIAFIDKGQERLRQQMKENIEEEDGAEFLKVLVKELHSLARQVNRCKSFYSTQRISMQQYLEAGVCYGATIAYAKERVHHKDPTNSPNKDARYIQAMIRVERARGGFAKVPETELERMGITVKRHDFPPQEGSAVQEFLDAVVGFDYMHAAVTLSASPEIRHTIYLSTGVPFELQDVNYPMNDDFRTNDFNEFLLFLGFWFAMHPQYTRVDELERIAPRFK